MNRQLSVSCSLLEDNKSLQLLLEQLVHSQQPFIFKDNHCECQHGKSYNKMRTFCTGNPKNQTLYRVKIWHEGDLISPTIIDSQLYHIVIREHTATELNLASKNVIVILDVQQIGDILALSIFELQKRCKMEFLMRKSHSLFRSEESKNRLKDLCLKYIAMTNRKGRLQTARFLSFHSQRKLNILRKHFTVWRISILEDHLSSLNEQLISEEYLCQGQNKTILQKCFKAWKTFHSSKSIPL